MGDRDDTAAAHQSQRGLDAHHAADRRRRDDRAVGLGAHGQRGQAGGDRRAGAGTRAAAIAVERIRVAREATACAPAAHRLGRAHIGPLAQVGLADDDGAGGAQLRSHVGVAFGPHAGQRQRTGGRAHAVAGGDIVFQQDGDAVQRTAHAPGGTLAVHLQRQLERFGIDLDDGVDARAGLVDVADARQVLRGQCM